MPGCAGWRGCTSPNLPWPDFPRAVPPEPAPLRGIGINVNGVSEPCSRGDADPNCTSKCPISIEPLLLLFGIE